MAVIRLKGIKQVTRKLATGEKRTYWYAWAGGPKLDGEPGTAEFIASFHAAKKTKSQIGEDTIGDMTKLYRSSSDWKKLSASSQKAYLAYMKLIEAKFGSMDLKATQVPRARAIFMAWRDKLADKPRKADYAWSTLSRVFSFAKNRGLITVNPCERAGRLYDADRIEILWKEEDLIKLFNVCSTHVCWVVMFALWTGQRQGDILRMPWSAYDGKTLRFRQSKTGRAMSIPVGRELAATIAELPKLGPVMLTSSDKRPWTPDGFRASFGKAMTKAGLDMHFHDLRGTAITRLSLAGCTTLEIASISGHNEKDVAEMLDRHYLGDRAKLAENASRKLETRTKSGKRAGKRAPRSTKKPDP